LISSFYLSDSIRFLAALELYLSTRSNQGRLSPRHEAFAAPTSRIVDEGSPLHSLHKHFWDFLDLSIQASPIKPIVCPIFKLFPLLVPPAAFTFTAVNPRMEPISYHNDAIINIYTYPFEHFLKA
jgi:hypothetical protein